MDNIVKIKIPLKVANDLEAIQRVQKGVLERLGCQACCSGHDIRFETLREFLVDESLNIREFGY